MNTFHIDAVLYCGCCELTDIFTNLELYDEIKMDLIEAGYEGVDRIM
jgi:hypothetical protein